MEQTDEQIAQLHAMFVEDREARAVSATATENSTENANPAKRIKGAKNSPLAVSEIMSACRFVHKGEKAFKLNSLTL